MTQAAPQRLALPVGERDHAQGPATAPVTLVEYGDYECPYCRAALPIVQELQRLLGDHLRFVYRHFPLTRQHPHARHAAEAAEAAGAQGRFQEMHISLFEHQQALDDDHLVQYAETLDLDTPRFRRELVEHVHAAHVRKDLQSGLDSGVSGTPTFYLDGVRYDGIVGVRQLLAAIREARPGVVTEAMGGEVDRRIIPRVVSRRSEFRRPGR
jgi:protein-disulfide isomerase